MLGMIGVLICAGWGTVGAAGKADGQEPRGQLAAEPPAGSAAPPAGSQGAALRMNFDGGMRVVEDRRGMSGRFQVADGKPSRAARSPQTGPSLGTPTLTFEGGDASQRIARIVDDPAQTGKRALEYEVKAPNVRIARTGGTKSRIQANVYDNVGVFELYGTVRLRLGKDMAALLDYPDDVDWLMISEWWNNAGWTGEPNPFRISVHIRKPQPGPGRQLHFGARASAKDPAKDRWSTTIWEHDDTGFAIPIDTWMTIEYYFKDGDDRTGRFLMAVTPDGGQRKVVLDVSNFTRHPDETKPDGLAQLNPMKLYTSGELTEYMRSRGKALQMLWSDLYLVPCGPAAAGQTTECARLAGLR
ncbi:MAG: hypothetical protein J0L57_02385 [Burkholderiales bacterium]|nr:hypothetical protein [Burkholderiales bacterium]